MVVTSHNISHRCKGDPEEIVNHLVEHKDPQDAPAPPIGADSGGSGGGGRGRVRGDGCAVDGAIAGGCRVGVAVDRVDW